MAVAATTLGEFAALGLLRPVTAEDDEVLGARAPDAALYLPYRLPGCLGPLVRDLLTEHERPADVQLARARMLERTVRLLQSCRAMGELARFPCPAEDRGAAAFAALRLPGRRRALAAQPPLRPAGRRPDRRRGR